MTEEIQNKKNYAQKRFTGRKIACFICIVSTVIMLIGILPVHGEEKIYDQVLRLHVIANSDSPKDQALKLKARDAVLGEVSELLFDSHTFDSALEVLSAPESLERITEAARTALEKEGCTLPVRVTVSRESYPQTSYQSLAFPSGTYTSLRVMIGECAGENWWCVLFPRLCLDAASERVDNEESFIEAGFTPEQYRVVTDSESPKYEVKFKLLEVISSLFGGGSD